MKIDCIYLKSSSQFGNFLAPWLQARNLNSLDYTNKSEDADEGIDGMVIFSENQEVGRELEEIKASFDRRQKPVHKIDINGTVMVAVSNLDLWLERNRCKKVLFVADDSLVKNPNLERLFTQLK
jgi:hypothetical protein